jgi:hypothetical protein
MELLMVTAVRTLNPVLYMRNSQICDLCLIKLPDKTNTIWILNEDSYCKKGLSFPDSFEQVKQEG